MRSWLALKILPRKEVELMAYIYVSLIINGLKTIDQVPKILRKQVEETLETLEVELPESK